MKTEDLMNALTDQDLALIADAEPGKQKKRRRRILYVVLIAAVVAVLASVLMVTVFAQNKEPEQPDPAPVGESESEQTSEQENITATEKTIEPASGQTEKTPTPTEPTGAESEEPSASASEVTPTLTPSETPTPQPTSDTPAVNTPFDDYTIPIDDVMDNSFTLFRGPFALYARFAVLKVTKIHKDYTTSRKHFDYSTTFTGNCPEDRIEYCTEIDYEVVFASHNSCSFRDSETKTDRVVSMPRMLENKTPVYVPDSFIDIIQEGDVIFCSLRFVNNKGNHVYFLAAGHDGYGYINHQPGSDYINHQPGSEKQYNTVADLGMLCKTVDGKVDSSCEWWESCIGINPIDSMRGSLNGLKNRAESEEKFKDSELFKNIPDLSLDDGMTFEEINKVYTWIWLVYQTFGEEF